MSNQSAAYQSIIARAWSDPEYKERLLRDPKTVLAEAGMQVPEHLNVQVHANTDNTLNLVLPNSPAGEAISEEELEQVAGGTYTILNLPACVVTAIAGCPSSYPVDCP
ncbi:MAG: NHLP leader peptide family RiPP precursor [Caldilineaceae bacterium]|nr:NHLP leader peptide family RiPP precursor [Caldilineaceae bacterium]MCB0140737.1 NHLP leader peptide family RiPP precursor [Caldilineaceae bacterium]